jgi:hypothetical protein
MIYTDESHFERYSEVLSLKIDGEYLTQHVSNKTKIFEKSFTIGETLNTIKEKNSF